MEGLFSLLQDAKAKKHIHIIKIGRHVPSMPRFFADDTLCSHSGNEIRDRLYHRYFINVRASFSSKINLEKLKISFNRNVCTELQNTLLSKLNFQAVEEHKKYLGLPTYVGRSKKVVF